MKTPSYRAIIGFRLGLGGPVAYQVPQVSRPSSDRYDSLPNDFKLFSQALSPVSGYLRIYVTKFSDRGLHWLDCQSWRGVMNYG